MPKEIKSKTTNPALKVSTTPRTAQPAALPKTMNGSKDPRTEEVDPGTKSFECPLAKHNPRTVRCKWQVDLLASKRTHECERVQHHKEVCKRCVAVFKDQRWFKKWSFGPGDRPGVVYINTNIHVSDCALGKDNAVTNGYASSLKDRIPKNNDCEDIDVDIQENLIIINVAICKSHTTKHCEEKWFKECTEEDGKSKYYCLKGESDLVLSASKLNEWFPVKK